MNSYNIINDASYSDVSTVSVSFISPNKIESSKDLEVKGFKIHNGYINSKHADEDAREIKKRVPEHDIFIASVGKVHEWDDVTKVDEVEYDDQKLNDLEKTRRENMSKMSLINEQNLNESKKSSSENRKEKMQNRLRQKMIERGSLGYVKPVIDNVRKIFLEEEVKKHVDNDYLDENDIGPYKYGCITIYSPHYIRGINQTYFKIRGIFETRDEMTSRIADLKLKNPHDRFYQFEIGKWIAFPERDDMNATDALMRLNYAMKCHLDNMDNEKDAFEKRKEELIRMNNMETKENKSNKTDNVVNDSGEKPSILEIMDKDDQVNVMGLANLLNDADLKDRFKSSGGESVVVDI